MVDCEKVHGLKYLLFGSLYFSEGLMVAITTVATSLYLREQAVSIPLTTLIVGIVNIPWMLKFIWGPVIDFFIKFGRKTFILFGGILTVFCTASLIVADSWWRLSILYAMIGFLMGGHSTVSCALFMDVTNPKIGATQYGIFTGIANVGLNGAGMITGTLTVSLGFTRTFIYAA